MGENIVIIPVAKIGQNKKERMISSCPEGKSKKIAEPDLPLIAVNREETIAMKGTVVAAKRFLVRQLIAGMLKQVVKASGKRV